MGKLLLIVVLAAAAFIAYQRGLLGNASLSEEDLLGLANEGNVSAMIKLGNAYDIGAFGKEDSGKAIDWLEQAIVRGSAEASFLAGVVYSKGGPGLERNYTKAAKHFEDAASKGVAEAHYSLGVFYEKGRGNNRNYPKAYFHYRLAARLGNQPDSKAVARVSRLLSEKQRQKIAQLISTAFVTFEKLKDDHLSSDLKDIIRSRATVKN